MGVLQVRAVSPHGGRKLRTEAIVRRGNRMSASTRLNRECERHRTRGEEGIAVMSEKIANRVEMRVEADSWLPLEALRHWTNSVG